MQGALDFRSRSRPAGRVAAWRTRSRCWLFPGFDFVFAGNISFLDMGSGRLFWSMHRDDKATRFTSTRLGFLKAGIYTPASR